MKHLLILTSLSLLLSACGSYNSIDSFYNAHKNDDNVTAVQVPRFMLSLLQGINPETNSLMNNVNDLRYIQLTPKTTAQNQLINTKINGITGSGFTELFRKNDNDLRTVISIRERKDVVKEIMVYRNNGKSNSILYMNGNFNPNRVRQLSKSGGFDNLTNALSGQYKFDASSLITPPITNQEQVD